MSIIIQHATTMSDLPSDEQLSLWATTAIQTQSDQAYTLTIRLVDKPEMQDFNFRFKQKNKPTNVLAFPFIHNDIHPDSLILGDILICAPLVAEEARAQNKTTHAHWAHLVIHGCLHCFGYDHNTNETAEKMEGLEIKLLEELNYPNPYGPKTK